MGGHQIAVAETEQPGIEQALGGLLALAFHADAILGRDDGLDIPCLGESSHIQVIVDHHQLVFQVGAGEAVEKKFKHRFVHKMD